jgi:hypothetical protein
MEPIENITFYPIIFQVCVGGIEEEAHEEAQ